MEESLEISAKTVEEAVANALEELGVSRDEVEVEILSEGKSGFLGFGGGEARVRVSLIQPAKTRDVAHTTAKEVLSKLLSLMKVSASIEEVEPQPKEQVPVKLNILGEDLGVLIGRRGNTLYSLQYIVYLIVSQRLKAHVPVSIDVEGYKERRLDSLKNLAQRMAEHVLATGQPATMEPMPANERRIIHLALREHPGVTTQSIGFGEDRKVTIMKKQ
jgi:spoIIIJ-associated protein